MTEQVVSLFCFQHGGVFAEIDPADFSIGFRRQLKPAAAQGPPVLIPFDRSTIGIAPGVCRIVKAAGIDDRPVHKIGARIMGIAVGVKNIRHGQFAHGDCDIIGRRCRRKLIGPGIDGLACSTHFNHLTNKQALNPKIRRAGTNLVGPTVGKSRHTQRIAEAKSLINFGIDPALSTIPESPTQNQRGVTGLFGPTLR